MTNLWLAVLSTVLTLVILTGLWHVKRHITTSLAAVAFIFQQNERSLRSHVVDEVNQLEQHVTSYGDSIHERVGRTESNIIDFLGRHADSLHKHAEDLRNHAKDLSDRAEVKAAGPRQAVSRN